MKKDIKKKFGLVWPLHVSNLVTLLIAARKEFDGDLDMFLILAVVGDRTFSAHKADHTLTFSSWQSNSLPHLAPDDINIRSIADFSGIPRETVRRKLAALSERGWIARNDDGVLHATVRARKELEPLTHAAIDYLSEMFTLLQKLPGFRVK